MSDIQLHQVSGHINPSVGNLILSGSLINPWHKFWKQLLPLVTLPSKFTTNASTPMLHFQPFQVLNPFAIDSFESWKKWTFPVSVLINLIICPYARLVNFFLFSKCSFSLLFNLSLFALVGPSYFLISAHFSLSYTNVSALPNVSCSAFAEWFTANE